MKTLISWIADKNDFYASENGVNIESSPNYSIHKHFWSYDRHLILCSSKEDDTKAVTLLNRLAIDFANHPAEIVYMDIKDVIDLTEIKNKVETKLLELADDEIDIFFSPGTSIMQVSWYICHSTLGLKTRLIQIRPPRFSESGNPELLEIEVEKSVTPVTAVLSNKSMKRESKDYVTTEKYKITKSIEKVYERAKRIANADGVTTLIYGESGTGKEHLARFIHENSIRKDKEYKTLNCSAFNDDLLESRLFGHEKGAFTGAERSAKGLFEEADGGSIFLDEIGDISQKMQQTLLRVLQEGEIQPIGGKTKKVNVRVIAATNKRLEDLCKNGHFRWDLYYRLKVTDLELPTLEERGKDEKEELLYFFLLRKKEQFKREKSINLTKEAKEAILQYPFPGNVRELENLVERLYVFYDDVVVKNDLPPFLKSIPEEFSYKWEDAEKLHIQKVLKVFNNNQRQAWMALGYGSLNTFKDKVRKYNIEIK